MQIGDILALQLVHISSYLDVNTQMFKQLYVN